ncbi:MAG: restriction endonuclease [Chloroflexota bacterium]|nr:restriction endonuclease [Chloroflexota bacterium]PLS79753.1 MAG: restriction endonuclease [Chloroflexota bacterium]
MASQPPVTDVPTAEDRRAEPTPPPRKRLFGASGSQQPRASLGQIIRELDWPILLLVGIGVGIVWVMLLLQGGAIQILAGLLPVTGGIMVGRRVKRHVNWHAALLGLLMALAAVVTVGILIFIEQQQTQAAGISPILLQAMLFAIVTLLPFPAFGVITASRSEQRQRAMREEQAQRGGRLERPGRVRSLDDLRALSLPQLGGYVSDLFRRHDFLVKDYRFEKDRIDIQMSYQNEPWLVRVYTLEKVKPGAAQELAQRMRAEGVTKGVVVTSMDFQEGAARSVKDKPVVLLDGPTLLSMDD